MRCGLSTWTTSGLLLVMVTTGCANKHKDRISLLEGANRNLTDQLNGCRTDLEASYRDLEELNDRLAVAMREAGNLRAELASIPPVQPVQTQTQVEAPGWTAVPGGAMIAIEGEILFPPGKAALRAEAKRALDAVVSAIRGEYGDKHIFVFGHTDDTPIKKSGWKDNWELSAQRALEVVRHMAANGVSASRLVAGGCGEHRPRANGSGTDARKRNRRVEIFAMDAGVLAGA